MRLKEAVMAVDGSVAAEKIGQSAKSLVMDFALGIALIVNAADVDVGDDLRSEIGRSLFHR